MARKTWDIRIEEAMDRGRFLKKDKKDSNNWKFCSVGERGIIPPYQRKKLALWCSFEINYNTWKLGQMFARYVCDNDFKESLEIHNKIKSMTREELLYD